MTLDFTYKKYEALINTISTSDYKVITIFDYLNSDKLPDKFIIIRHDVDLNPICQLKYAKMEKKYNLHTSYYFRCISKIFNEQIISQIKEIGHEVGYHYEVFTKAKGDAKEAINIFKKEQELFRSKWDSQTVCPHGGSFVETTDGYSLINILKILPKILMRKKVFSNYINFDLWKDNSFKELMVLGDAYKSIDFTNILYLSDTGRSWESRYKRLDKVNSNLNGKYNIKKTDDIINIIKHGKENKIYILVHFEQWKDNYISWLSWYVSQIIRRYGKKLIFK